MGPEGGLDMKKMTKQTLIAGVAALSIALLTPAALGDNGRGRGRDHDRHRDRDRDRHVEQRDRARDHRQDHRVDRRVDRRHRQLDRRVERRVERHIDRRYDRRDRYDRYDRYDRRHRVNHRFDRNRYDRFRIPARIVDLSYDTYNPYFQRRVYFPLHNHRHEIFLFPVRIDGQMRWREHAYCNGDLFNAHGSIFIDGPRFSVSLGF
jgi:hypothetical protein